MNQAQLLEFLAPGFLHGISNSLFKIQGQAELLGRGLSEAPQDVGASVVGAEEKMVSRKSNASAESSELLRTR